MPMIDSYLFTIGHSRSMLLKLVADLSDEQMTFQPAPKVNHPAWVLGHLLNTEYGFLNLISGEGAPVWLDATFKETYDNKSQPVGDKAKYKPKAFYVEKLTEVREKIVTRLKTMTAADFQAPHPDPVRRERFPTVGHMVMLYGTWHEAYHAGQLSTWRRVQGLPAV